MLQFTLVTSESNRDASAYRQGRIAGMVAKQTKAQMSEEIVGKYLEISSRRRNASPQADCVNIVVVVPTYNEESTIRNLLLSLNNQLYLNFEVILVDKTPIPPTYRCWKQYQLEPMPRELR